MKNFRDALREEMKNPEFKKAWDALEPEFRRLRENLDGKNISSLPKAFKKFPVARYRKVVHSVKIG